MASISDQYNQLQIALLHAKKGLEQLDNPNTTLEDLHGFEATLRTIMKDLKEITNKAKADRSDQKLIWQRRIRAISDDYYELKNNFSRLSNHKITMMKRNDLLSRDKDKAEMDVEASLLKENDSLLRSTTMADYYLEMGRSSLSSLYDQGNLLKKAQRRVLDMANSLGITGNIIQNAMSRSWWDRCIVYTGIIIISLCLVGVWYYKRR